MTTTRTSKKRVKSEWASPAHIHKANQRAKKVHQKHRHTIGKDPDWEPAQLGEETTPDQLAEHNDYLDDREYDIREAANQLELERKNQANQDRVNKEKQRKKEQDEKDEQRNADRQAYYDEKRAYYNSREQQRQERDAAEDLEKSNKAFNSTVKGVGSTLLNTEGSSSGIRFGSLDLSWGMFFLIMLIALWLGVAPAPNHNNDTRLKVIWKAFIGQEEIA